MCNEVRGPSRQRWALVALSLALVGTALPVPAADISPGAHRAASKARAYRLAHEGAIVAEFSEFLAIPNNARDGVHIRQNADRIVRMLRSRGMSASLLELEGSPPAVFGELRVPGARHTVTFYAHYDGQPVDPKQWSSDPFTPVLRDKPVEEGGKEVAPGGRIDPEWRLYARSAGDDKAPIVGMMAALDAMRASGMFPSVNLKFFFEGEEEAGSPHLGPMLNKYADRLGTELWIICDGPVHQSGRKLVFFGVRGHAHLDLTVYGPNHGLHSGSYGNWAPNPISILTNLLAGMRDDEANVHIAGFLDSVREPSAVDRAAIQRLPDQEIPLKRALGIGRSEGEPARLESRLLEPAFNVVGIQGGHVGNDAANVISSEATAAVDLRLVPDQTPESVRQAIELHIQKQGYFVVHEPPDAATRLSHPRVALLRWDVGYPPQRTDMNSPVAVAFVRAVEKASGQEVLRVPALGGSVPMYLFAGPNRIPVIGLPIANYDDNQHTADENLRIQNLWDGIEMYAGLFSELGKLLPTGR